MTAIKILPDYMINRLKAGEVVERPSSVMKELVENSLDAQASHITITLDDGGKQLIQVDDNGLGINHSDSELVFARYATSKISNEDDLHELASYGFRGEALASIGSVAKVTIRSKTQNAITATKIVNHGEELFISTVPVPFATGTSVMVEDLFYNTPARLKFMKSSQTEYFYCYQLFVDFALIHYQLRWTLVKNGKVIFDLESDTSVQERMKAIYKKARGDNLIDLNLTGDMLSIQGVVGDSTIRFSTGDNLKFFVNERPVTDKIIKKAVMQAYERQISFGEFPLAILFITIHPGLVDVNVHPRKTEVRFIDPGSVFNRVTTLVAESLAGKKVTHWAGSHGTTTRSAFPSYGNFAGAKNRPAQRVYPQFGATSAQDNNLQQRLELEVSPSISSQHDLYSQESNDAIDSYYKVIGQVWDSYIVLQSSDGLYYIDQHALAERINFEKMRKEAKEKRFGPFPLLQSITIDVMTSPEIESKCEQLNDLGFDCNLISENKVVVHAVPQLFSDYKVDIEKLLDKVFPMDEINFDSLLDLIFAMRACRASVKAGDKLTSGQMEQLIKDGFEFIDGMFVCQHGRPFFVKVDKEEVDVMFDR